ncbi:site-specific integrase [Rheinheimera baltica]|uniref:Site-specific integrase n=1 Tax=Rheinheimera baltica TaxID=67576 RepID=A0ABT9I0K0_9GAMM|nr:site-specific integrase [Rheinheimera baltica]MDP5136713.1 site-specific integrase [Rheinheimera baltica]
MSTACPCALYLGRLSPTSRSSIASQLKSVAKLMNWPDDYGPYFAKIDYQQALVIRAVLINAGWQPRSVNRAMIAIRGIVKVAVMLGTVDQREAAHIATIDRLKHPEHQGSPLSTKQVNQLFTLLERGRSAVAKRNVAIFALLLGTGLRRSELVSLILSDYNRRDHTLLVRHGKGNKSRLLFLPKWCQEHLAEWLKIRRLDDGYLLCKTYTSGKVVLDIGLTVSAVYRLIKDKLAAIGVPNASPHDMRRTFITRLLEQNVDINTVRQMAGHADISTTTVYDKRDHQFMKSAAHTLCYKSAGGEHDNAP